MIYHNHTSSSRYRLFIGIWDPELEAEPWSTAHDYRQLVWSRARHLLADHLERIEHDPCPLCAADATSALLYLAQVRPGSFECEISGTTYLIREELHD